MRIKSDMSPQLPANNNSMNTASRAPAAAPDLSGPLPDPERSFVQVHAPEDLIAPMVDQNINMSHCARDPSLYADILRGIPKSEHLNFLYASPEQQALFGGRVPPRDPANGRDPDIISDRLAKYLDSLDYLSSFYKEALLYDVRTQLELMANLTRDDRMTIAIVLKDPDTIFGGFNAPDPRYLSKYHVDGGTSLNLTWTPASDYPAATEMQDNQNVIRENMRNGRDEGYDLPKFLRDPSLSFRLPINHLALMAGEIDGRLDHVPSFNAGNGCVHRGTPVEPDKRRLQVAITSIAVPETMRDRLS